ncbi:MAG: hypothetical protein HPY69_10085 [Armatimonadetes bacterium]|nr:hypothetical protein [Armatimonadota bacterium]
MTARTRLLSLMVLAALVQAISAAPALPPVDLTVMTLADDGSPGTLRSKLATANSDGVPNRILFDVSLAGGTIHVGDSGFGTLTLTEPGTEINGDINYDGKPDITISGDLKTGILNVASSAANCVLRGLCICYSTSSGISVGGENCTIRSCYIGTDRSGRLPQPNAGDGISITSASGAQIGGTDPKDRNIIAGNLGNGIYVYFSGGVTITNLLCGLAADGSTALPNTGDGIYLYLCGDIAIGSPGLPIKTVLSGNNQNGINGSRVVGLSIANCRVGTNLAGTQARPNGSYGVYLYNCSDVLIGATTTLGWNVVSGNDSSGIYANGCPDIKIKGNRVGTDANGGAALGNGSSGVYLDNCPRAYVGGTTAAARNIISANSTGISMGGCQGAYVVGNYIGLNRTGDKPLPNSDTGLSLSGSAYCTVGGNTAAKRNVIVARQNGVSVYGNNALGNRILGNYIGWLADGTTPAPGNYGVYVSGGPGGLVVGAAGQGNKILAKNYGLYLDFVRSGSVIEANTIGAPVGSKAFGSSGIYLSNGSPRIASNTILQQRDYGLYIYGYECRPIVAGNTIRLGSTGILIDNDAQPNLGNLGNTSTLDDGGNRFIGQSGSAIANYTSNDIKAEGNDFGSTQASVIDGKIYDQLDDPSRGLVDYSPLAGGVIPTSVRTAGAMTVAAAPTRNGGAQIVITLSAPAEVQAEILNIAGRVVSALPPVQGKAGINSLLWNGRSNAGTQVPAGAYLCRVTARGPEGQQQIAMTRMMLAR